MDSAVILKILSVTCHRNVFLLTENSQYPAMSRSQENGHLLDLPTGSKERGVLGAGSVPVAILPSCQDMKTTALQLQKHEYSWVVKIRNISEAVLRPQYSPWSLY